MKKCNENVIQTQGNNVESCIFSWYNELDYITEEMI